MGVRGGDHIARVEWVILTAGSVRDRAVVEGAIVIRVELDGAIVVLDGAVVLALRAESIPRLLKASTKLGSSLVA